MDPRRLLNPPHLQNPIERRGLLHPRHITRFATFNSRTLQWPGDAELLAAELNAAGVGICGLQEVRRRGSGNEPLPQCTAEGWRLLWSTHDSRHVHGVGALLGPEAARALTDWTPVDERLLLLRFAAGAIKVSVVVAYAPTDCNPASTKNAFYWQLRGLLDSVPPHHMLVVLGDMKLGWEQTPRGCGGVGVPAGPPPSRAAAPHPQRHACSLSQHSALLPTVPAIVPQQPSLQCAG